MKKINEYSKNGYDFKIVQRQDNLVISSGKSRKHGSQNWEVVEIQSHNGLTIGGVSIPPSEFIPRNEQWGTKGWSFATEEKAFEFFNEKAYKEAV